MQTFKSLTLKKWRQFEQIDLDLSSNLVVLTGPNGCGKTTVLSVLGRHFGWNLHFLSTPYLTKDEKRRFYTDAQEAVEKSGKEDLKTGERYSIGTIVYNDGTKSELYAPVGDNTQYQLAIDNQKPVTGLHIPSHRPPPAHHSIRQIPVNPKTSQQHYQEFQSHLFHTYNENPQKNPASVLKETLVALAIFGEGNSSVVKNDEYKRIFDDFQKILLKMLPESLGFKKLEVQTPDVILSTETGKFPLEAMSGGINALFGIAWQIHMYGCDKDACTVLIDEPENHLHPSMQRELLPRLIRAFPTYKFVVSTHSPFVVSSTPEASVYAFTYNDKKKVLSTRLTEADLAASPNTVLREILDVPVTMPIWVEQRIESVLKKYENATADAETIKNIRQDLEDQGLGHSLGDFLVQKGSEEKAK